MKQETAGGAITAPSNSPLPGSSCSGCQSACRETLSPAHDSPARSLSLPTALWPGVQNAGDPPDSTRETLSPHDSPARALSPHCSLAWCPENAGDPPDSTFPMSPPNRYYGIVFMYSLRWPTALQICCHLCKVNCFQNVQHVCYCTFFHISRDKHAHCERMFVDTHHKLQFLVCDLLSTISSTISWTTCAVDVTTNCNLWCTFAHSTTCCRNLWCTFAHSTPCCRNLWCIFAHSTPCCRETQRPAKQITYRTFSIRTFSCSSPAPREGT